jgi:phosphatidylserine decarboxylase
MIAREGVAPLAVAIVAGVVVLHYVGPLQSIPLWLLALLMLMLFRDPEREIPSQPLAVISPADGRVTDVAAVYDPYLQRDSTRVTIQMTPYGVYTTRSPVEGKVLEPPNFPAGEHAPHGVWLQTDEGDDIVMVMSRGPLHNEPRCNVRFGDRIGQGKRCGFVHLGGRVEIYLPQETRVSIKQGDAVQSGSDIIGKLVRA